MPVAAFRKLVGILFESKKPEHVHAHNFLLLEWNLISRAEYFVDANIDLMSFTKDALFFNMSVTKTEQEGVKTLTIPGTFTRARSTPKSVSISPSLAISWQTLPS